MSKLTFEEYKALALRSIKPHDSRSMAVLDWTIGIGGETGELLECIQRAEEDKMILAKELGDVLWYTTALTNELGISVDNSVFTDSYEEYTDKLGVGITLTIEAAKILEAVKHYVFHKETAVSDKLVKLIIDFFGWIRSTAHVLGFTIEDCAELNAAKLAHRYNLKNGGAYSHDASAKRHSAEMKFEDTATYKRLYQRITGEEVEIGTCDVEVI